VWEAIQAKELNWLAESVNDVSQQMTFATDEKRSFHRFLDKFKILDEIYWDEELIDASIKAVCDEFEKEGSDFVWLDFSINKYMRIGWQKKEAIQFIHSTFEKYRPNSVGLILSLKYESTRTSQKQYASLIEDPDVVDMLFGLDLVGDENYFDNEFYRPILQQWRSCGKMTRAHVGEYGSAKNVRDAILSGVTNVAHGIKITNSPEIMQLAIDNDICFDVAPTSNFITGVVDTPKYHPMTEMLFAGLRLTIGSDDPVQCGISIKEEYEVAKKYGVTEDQLAKIKLEAITQTEKFNN